MKKNFNSFLSRDLLVVFIFLVTNIVAFELDFILDAPGTSISAYDLFACAIEALPGVEIGGKPVCWGEDSEFEILEAPRDRIFVQISTSSSFVCGLTDEQQVVCWGSQYGASTRIEGLFTQVACAQNYACGILSDGNLKCWGYKGRPGTPKENEYKFVQIGCSVTHCAGLLETGTVISWDENGYHHDKTHSNKKMRVPMIEVEAGVGDEEDFYADEEEDEEGKGNEEVVLKAKTFRQITVADGMTCGIDKGDASIFCWGYIGHESDKKARKQPFSRPGPYRQVSAGGMGICALHGETNTVDCWGKINTFYNKDASLEWDQITVGARAVCMVSMEDSSGHCFSPFAYLRNSPSGLEIA